MSRDAHVASFRERLRARDLVVAPCCYDALSARLIEQAGFEATFMSGPTTASSGTPRWSRRCG
jgi:2-methylisocitrate lyase-like PEP mutase family enzyme